MSRANRLFYQIIFAVGVLFGFCIPAVASSVTSKSNTLVANLSGPQVQMSSNWVSNTAGAVQFVCCRSNGIGYWNLLHFFKPKPKPKPKPPHSSPVAVADGDPPFISAAGRRSDWSLLCLSVCEDQTENIGPRKIGPTKLNRQAPAWAGGGTGGLVLCKLD